jgi:hypothetical protein
VAYRIQLQDDGVARVTFDEPVTFDDALAAFRALTCEDAFVASRRVFDMRGCDLRVTSSELRRLAYVGKEEDCRPSRIALIADRDVTFGRLRQHRALRQSAHTDISVFRDEADAMRWLEDPHAS